MELGHWMLTASYLVVSSDALGILSLWAPHWMPNCAMGFILFLTFSICGNLACTHWVHGIEDTNALDVVRYYYLFGSSNVRIQHNQQRYSHGSLREPLGLLGITLSQNRN